MLGLGILHYYTTVECSLLRNANFTMLTKTTKKSVWWWNGLRLGCCYTVLKSDRWVEEGKDMETRLSAL